MSNPDPKREVIGERLRSARIMAGLSQGQAAKLLDLHRPTISEIEAGHRRVAAEELPKFAELYGVSVAWVTGTRDEADLTDPQLALVARELKKLKPADMERVMEFIAAVQGARESAK